MTVLRAKNQNSITCFFLLNEFMHTCETIYDRYESYINGGKVVKPSRKPWFVKNHNIAVSNHRGPTLPTLEYQQVTSYRILAFEQLHSAVQKSMKHSCGEVQQITHKGIIQLTILRL